MDFKTATDILGGSPTHEEIAAELDVSVHLVRQARLQADKEGHRSAPSGWERAIARLARTRSQELEQLAEILERAAEGSR